MDRVSWLRCIERWFHTIALDEKTINGYMIPDGLPVLAGPRDIDSDGKQGARPIIVYIRANWHGSSYHANSGLEEAWGKFLVPDIEVLVLIDNINIYFIPWEAIVYIREQE